MQLKTRISTRRHIMTKISEKLYNNGFHLEGKGNRIDIVDSENKKHIELLFLQGEVLAMTPYDFCWGKSIESINVYGGLPQVELIR